MNKSYYLKKQILDCNGNMAIQINEDKIFDGTNIKSITECESLQYKTIVKPTMPDDINGKLEYINNIIELLSDRIIELQHQNIKLKKYIYDKLYEQFQLIDNNIDIKNKSKYEQLRDNVKKFYEKI